MSSVPFDKKWFEQLEKENEEELRAKGIDVDSLEQATDEEIHEAMEEVFAELDEEVQSWFTDEALAEVRAQNPDFYREFEEAKTWQERTKVMDKYGINYQI